MIINGENMTALEQTINAAFQRGLATKPVLSLDFMTTMFPSAGALNLYPFLVDMAQWREWLGDRLFGNLEYKEFQVLNRNWEKSYRLPKRKIDDNQYSTFPSMVEVAAAGWPYMKNKLRMDVYTGNTACFDGKAIFADDHAYGANAIDNLVAVALTEDNFNTAFVTASAWKFANDEPCGTKFTHLLVGPKLRNTAKVIVAATKDGGDPNPNANRVEVVEVPEFSGAYDDYWTLQDNSGPIKSVILQMRQEAEITIDALPEHVKRTGNLDVMADGRMSAAPTFPHLQYMGRV